MRWLLGSVVVLALLWGGWWLLASTVLERGAAGWFAERRSEGMVAQYDALAVRGFPGRLDLTVVGPALGNPVTGYGWQAPGVQVRTQGYRPWQMTALLPEEQRIELPALADGVARNAVLRAETLRAGAAVRPALSLPLDRLTLEGDALRLTLPEGGLVAVDSLRGTFSPVPGQPQSYALDIAVQGLAPPEAVRAGLPDPAALPERIAAVTVDAELGFSAPLDRHAGRTQPRLVMLDLQGAALDWGDLRIAASGQLVPDAAGYAEGRIAISVENWRLGLAVAVAAGWIRPEVAPTWERALAILAQTGTRGVLEVPLTLRKGRASLGPLPIGPAPRFASAPAPEG
jgi:hypothetical protein